MTEIADWVPAEVKKHFANRLNKCAYRAPKKHLLLRLLSDPSMKSVFEKLTSKDRSINLMSLITLIDIAADGILIYEILKPIKKSEVRKKLQRVSGLADQINDILGELGKGGIKLPDELTDPLSLLASVGDGDLFYENLEEWRKGHIQSPPRLSAMVRQMSAIANAASMDEPEYIFEGESKIKGFTKFGNGIHEQRNYIAKLSDFLIKNFNKYFDNEVAVIANFALNPDDKESPLGSGDVAKIRSTVLSKTEDINKDKDS